MSTDTLGDALPRQIERVQELLPHYDAIPQGVFGAAMLRAALKRATQAMASGDVVEMLRAYEELKDCQ